MEFSDGTMIKMTYPGVNQKGFLFGERELWFEGIYLAYDEGNNLFAEIVFGPRKKGFFGKVNEPLDYVWGHIY